MEVLGSGMVNRRVIAELCGLLPARPRILEVGAGLGTMVARLLDWEVLDAGEYTLLDVDPDLLRESRTWLPGWAGDRYRSIRPANSSGDELPFPRSVGPAAAIDVGHSG